MQAKVTLVVCAAALLGAAGQRAEAQTSAAAAQVLFDEAMTLMDAGKHTDACPKLNESLRLDRAMGTEFQLAVCYEKVGKIASAWSHFIAVAEEAGRLKETAREEFARKRAGELEPRLPKLTIEVLPKVASLRGLEIRQGNTVIGSPLWGNGFPVDPGEHVISARADQKKKWEQPFRLQEGKALTVTIPMLQDLPQSGADADEKNAASRPAGALSMRDKPSQGGGTGQRAAALAVGGIGAAGIILGGIFGVRAFSQWESAMSHCQDGDKTRCTPEGIALSESASTSGTVSTIMFAVGGAGLAGGVILWFTAGSGSSSGSNEESAVVLLPSVGKNHVSGVMQMRF